MYPFTPTFSLYILHVDSGFRVLSVFLCFLGIFQNRFSAIFQTVFCLSSSVVFSVSFSFFAYLKQFSTVYLFLNEFLWVFLVLLFFCFSQKRISLVYLVFSVFLNFFKPVFIGCLGFLAFFQNGFARF